VQQTEYQNKSNRIPFVKLLNTFTTPILLVNTNFKIESYAVAALQHLVFSPLLSMDCGVQSTIGYILGWQWHYHTPIESVF
jgi:hypothetical protein